MTRATDLRALLLALLVFSAPIACSSAGVLDQEADCNDICSRHAECFNRDYDVTGCQKRCVDRAEDSESVAEDVENCDICLDGTSCVESEADCKDACSSIIP